MLLAVVVMVMVMGTVMYGAEGLANGLHNVSVAIY